jgi:putative membrane protein
MAAAVMTLGFSAITSAQAADTTKTKSNLSANDKKFVTKAYRDGMGEIANAKMAKEKAKDETTKNLADHMISDHSKANDGLRAIAKKSISISRAFTGSR